MAEAPDPWLDHALEQAAEARIPRWHLALAARRTWSGPAWNYARALQVGLERGYFRHPGRFGRWSRKPAELTPAGRARLNTATHAASFDRLQVREQGDDRG